ncbi:MAG: 2-oxoacid:acceptor oxidoreductase family protein, partial [Verrucomicrobiota bacterium]
MDINRQLEEETASPEVIEEVTIRFAGDSGDGMQLTGSRFTIESAFQGNDLATQPDFPAEIRAPAGSLPGVSAFQIRIGSVEISTAGDDLNVLVAMNPAALKTNLKDLKQNGILICNEDAFSANNLRKAAYEENPLEDDELKNKYTVVTCPITTLALEAVKEFGLPTKIANRCKNFFALGMVYWLFSRPMENTEAWLKKKFARKPALAEANI